MGKPGVMFYFEVRPCLNRLTREEKGDLFEAILDYGQYGVLPELEGPTGVAWDFLQPKLDRDNDRYDRTVIRNAYARYAKEATKNNGQKMTFDQWKETVDLSALTQALSESTWELSESPWESSVAQTTNYKQQTTNSKQQTPTPQEFLEPAATPAIFSPPTREAVLSYCQEQGLLMDVDSFLDYYTANGWTIGKSPMKNWQAAVRRWCRKETQDAEATVSHSWNVGITI